MDQPRNVLAVVADERLVQDGERLLLPEVDGAVDQSGRHVARVGQRRRDPERPRPPPDDYDRQRADRTR